MSRFRFRDETKMRNGLFRKILAIGIVVLFFGAIGMTILGGNMSVMAADSTIYVDDDNTGGPWDGSLAYPYQNITSGLVHASNGDTVHVFGGTYSENVVLNKSVILTGDSKPVIDGMGGIGINITIDESFTYGVTVDGFDITNSSYGVYLVMQNIENLIDTSVTIGDIVIANNRISSSADGIYVYVNKVGYNMSGSSSVVMGDFRITGNVVSSMHGIYIDAFYGIGSYMYNGSSFTMGNLDFSNNTIDSGSEGLYLDDFDYLGYMMYDDSHFTMGSILANENTIHSDGIGIRVYGIYDLGRNMYGTSYFSMGNIEFNDNSIVSQSDGIYVDYLMYYGYYMEGTSSFTMGNIEFARNLIDSNSDGIYVDSLDFFGCEMHDYASFEMGDILVNNNVIYSDSQAIYIKYLQDFGYYMYNSSSFLMGNIEFCGNTITSGDDGIYIYYLHGFGYYMYYDASFEMGSILLNDNTVTSYDDGIYVGYLRQLGINIYNASSFVMGNIEFEGNTISNCQNGMTLTHLENATIRNNIIQDCYYGIYLLNSTVNLIYHNNFLYNTIQAYITFNYTNTWDNNYPSGGNYWSDYNGTDLYSGPDQNIAGSDFRGDTPYVIDSNNTDRYPLMIPYEAEPPTIAILSPENKTYSVDTVSLTFTVDETTTWVGYSLDAQANVTITGNTTLPVLSDGSHHIVVYANDTFDNMGQSTVYFTVDTIPPTIAVVSPENKTYNIDDAPLTFTVDEATSWIGYTLDGQANVTITGNTTLFDLSDGSHNLVVYANGTAGHMGSSSTVYFAIDTTVPSISILSPENKTYDATDLQLNFTVDEPVSWIAYSLDGQANVTITGNTTLTGLSEGSHNIIVYAADTAGNTEASEIIYFTIETKKEEAFPIWIWIIAAIVIIAVVGAALLVYFTKVKKTTEKA